VNSKAFIRLGCSAAVVIFVSWITLQFNYAALGECNAMVMGAVGHYHKTHSKWPTNQELQATADPYCFGKTRPVLDPIDQQSAYLTTNAPSLLTGRTRARRLILATKDGIRYEHP